MDGLVDHQQRQSFLDLHRIDRSSRFATQQVVDLRVDLFLCLVRLRVEVETAPVFAPVEARVIQLRHRARAFETAVGKGTTEVLCDVSADVDPDLVHEGERPNRVAEIPHRPIHVLDPGTLLHQEHRLVEVGRKDAGGVEAGAVFDHDAGLALGGAEGVGGGSGPRGSLFGDDNLEQRHLRHRREIVHPDHPLGVTRLSRDFTDRQGGGVGGEDRVIGHSLLDLGQNPSFELEIFEDRLDHEISSFEVVDLSGQQESRPPTVRLDTANGAGSDLAFETVVDRPRRLAQDPVGEISDDNRAQTERHRRYSRAHESAAEHGQPIDLSGFAFALLGLVHGVEEAYQVAALGADGELAKVITLTRQPRDAALFEARFHTIEDRRRRWVESPGLPCHLLVRLPQDNRSAGWRRCKSIHQVLFPGVALERALGQRQCRPGARFGNSSRGRDGIDETHLLRPPRTHAFAGQQHRQRRNQTDSLDQPLRAPPGGQQPEHHLGLGEHRLRVVGREDVVTGQRDLEPAPEGGAVDRSHHWLFGGEYPLEQRVSLPRHITDLCFTETFDELEVGTGDEGIGFGGHHHHRADIVLVEKGRHLLVELFHDRR